MLHIVIVLYSFFLLATEVATSHAKAVASTAVEQIDDLHNIQKCRGEQLFSRLRETGNEVDISSVVRLTSLRGISLKPLLE